MFYRELIGRAAYRLRPHCKWYGREHGNARTLRVGRLNFISVHATEKGKLEGASTVPGTASAGKSPEMSEAGLRRRAARLISR